MNNLAKQLTEKAFKKKQLDKLLLGKKPYKYIPKYSPAIDTDLALLIKNGFYTLEEQNLPDFSHELSKTLMKLAKTYIGVIPVASVILLETYGRKENNSPFSFDLSPIVKQLKDTISKYSQRLKQDRSGYGQDWDNGLYGEVRNIAQNTVELNGPDFLGLDSAE